MADRSSLEVVSDYFGALLGDEPERAGALRSDDFVMDLVHLEAFQRGPLPAVDTRVFWPSWLAGFPERDFEVIRTIVADEVVVAEWVFTGTHSAALGPPVFADIVEPTGKTIRFRGVHVFDIHDGLIRREAMYMDQATLIVELGIEL